ncbi:MAG: LarC family nickel insertion protein, partial [Actinobacteria bacterium]|nr:LarC family nickel insertion protein [Actinomycetota bacterium]
MPSMLYVDPWMGVAGDMLMAALLDTDRDDSRLETIVRGSLAAIGLDPQILSVERDIDQGITCTRVRVWEDKNAPLRHLSDLIEIIDGGTLPASVKERSGAAVERLARVEASIHGCSAEEIHFHEVGAIDTLVDIVGVFSLVEALGVENVVVGPIPVGGGTVSIAHGRMKVPAPATAALLVGYPVVGGPEMRELTTPTGALLVKELRAQPGPIPPMVVEDVGYGCGNMRFSSGPNILRVFVGHEVDNEARGFSAPGQDVVI